MKWCLWFRDNNVGLSNSVHYSETFNIEKRNVVNPSRCNFTIMLNIPALDPPLYIAMYAINVKLLLNWAVLAIALVTWCLSNRFGEQKYKKKIPHTGDKESLDRCG